MLLAYKITSSKEGQTTILPCINWLCWHLSKRRLFYRVDTMQAPNFLVILTISHIEEGKNHRGTPFTRSWLPMDTLSPWKTFRYGVKKYLTGNVQQMQLCKVDQCWSELLHGSVTNVVFTRFDRVSIAINANFFCRLSEPTPTLTPKPHLLATNVQGNCAARRLFLKTQETWLNKLNCSIKNWDLKSNY